MNSNKINNSKLFYFVVFLFVTCISYYINSSVSLRVTRKIAESIFLLNLPILFFFIINYFLNERIYKTWIKFTLFYFIISSIIILIAPVSTHGMDIYPATKENLTIVLASAYSLVSLFLIIYKSLRKDKNQ